MRDEGICKLNQQDYRGAEVLLEESVKGFESLEDYGELAMSQSKLAAVLAKAGKASEAEELAYQGVLNANKSSNIFYIATAYQEAGRVHFISNKPELIPECLYAALGALKLEDDAHAKRHAELFLGLSWAYSKLGNKELSSQTKERGEECLKELDEATANRIRGFFEKD